jgi:hypothetical protein
MKSGHDRNCDWQLDQYANECTCGATRPRAPGFLPYSERLPINNESTEASEIERLRAWLSEIADCDLGDQPVALNVPEADWAKRHTLMLRRMAHDALAGKDLANG